VAERPPKPGPGPARRGVGAPRGPAHDDERTNVAEPPGGDAPTLTGGPDREYRSGEIEPSAGGPSPAVPEGDWEEKTVVDDGQLYKDGPNTTSTIGTITSDEELTIDEPHMPAPTGLSRPLPAPGRPAPASARPAPAPGRPAPGRSAPAPGRPAPASARPAPARPAPAPAKSAAHVPEAAQGKLVVLAGNDAGREYALQGKPISVGRGIDNDVVLTDIAVSRRHMTLAFDGSRYQLTDKGSGNGTIINQRVETGTRTLFHGDRIEIGNTVFRLEHPASEKAAWAAGNAPASAAPQAKAAAAGPPAQPAPLPLPLPLSSPGQAVPPDTIEGVMAQPHRIAASGPPATIPTPSAGGDLPFERPQQPESARPEAPSPWTAPPSAAAAVSGHAGAAPGQAAPAPAMPAAPAPAMSAPAMPARAPLVPDAPVDARKLLIGIAATVVGLIGIAVGGLMISDDSAAAAVMEPPVRAQEMLLPLIQPLLELGAPVPDAIQVPVPDAIQGLVPGSPAPDQTQPSAAPSAGTDAGADQQ
jgi:hypothetical protein